MKIPLLMIFSFVFIIAKWAKTALEDGKISAQEGLQLIQELAKIIGVPLELDITSPVIENVALTPGPSKEHTETSFLESSKKTTLDERPKVV